MSVPPRYDLLAPQDAWSLIADFTFPTFEQFQDEIRASSDIDAVLRQHHRRIRDFRLLSKKMNEAFRHSPPFYFSMVFGPTIQIPPSMSDEKKATVLAVRLVTDKPDEEFQTAIGQQMPGMINLLVLESRTRPIGHRDDRIDLIRDLRAAFRGLMQHPEQRLLKVNWTSPGSIVDIIRASPTGIHIRELTFSDNFISAMTNFVADWPDLVYCEAHTDRPPGTWSLIARIGTDNKPTLKVLILIGAGLGRLLIEFCQSGSGSIEVLKLGRGTANDTSRLPSMEKLEVLHCNVTALSRLLVFQQPSLMHIRLTGFDTHTLMDQLRRANVLQALDGTLRYALDYSRVPLLSSVKLQDVTRINLHLANWNDDETETLSELGERLDEADIDFVDLNDAAIYPNDNTDNDLDDSSGEEEDIIFLQDA
ncbi:hypothetical protein SCHPADRAFT_890716 [Schizopora paradoxa]|uniref:Uncharacterized protein n=1 Tax=Schizopora paradoxa TaxID=27342 RepID=A0A0H2RT03_9AGAM|nr:hypothetical protein SCHPADRAFT_890716 [Schizopora paradoxa]